MINLLEKFPALKSWNKLQLDNKKIFLTVLFCLLTLYIDLRFIIKLQLAGIMAVKPKIMKLKKDVDNLAKDLVVMEDLKNRQVKDKQQTGVVKKIISDDEVPLLLQDILNLANKNKVKIIQINTARDVKVKEEIIAGEKLLPITIKLELTCTYHALGSFINTLEKARQFIELQEMKIIRNPNNYFMENASLALKTYAKK